MAAILKQHSVGMNDKVSLEKVEVLLNSVLKELQKEKMRSRQLEEQLLRLTAEQKATTDLSARLLRAEQQQASSAATLTARLNAVDNAATKDVPKAPQPQTAPPQAAPLPPPRPPPQGAAAITAQQFEELRKQVRALEAKVADSFAGFAPTVLAPAPPPVRNTASRAEASGGARAKRRLLLGRLQRRRLDCRCCGGGEGGRRVPTRRWRPERRLPSRARKRPPRSGSPRCAMSCEGALAEMDATMAKAGASSAEVKACTRRW